MKTTLSIIGSEPVEIYETWEGWHYWFGYPGTPAERRYCALAGPFPSANQAREAAAAAWENEE